MIRFFKFCALSVLAIIILGCAVHTTKLTVPNLQTNTKIAIVSFLGDQATQYVNGRPVSNYFTFVQDTIPLSGFAYDNYLSNKIVTGLEKRGFNNVVSLKVPSNNPITSITPGQERFSWSSMESKGRSYMRQATSPGQYSKIIIIVPENMQSDDAAIQGQFRYGVAESYYFGKLFKATFFAGYGVIVLDGSTYEVLAERYGNVTADASSYKWEEGITPKSIGVLALKGWLHDTVADDIATKTFSMFDLSNSSK